MRSASSRSGSCSPVVSQVDGLRDRQRAGAAESRRERLALEQLHHDERVVLGLPDIVDLDDARVLDRGRGARLVEEPLEQLLVARDLGQQHLHRGAPAEHLVHDLVHHTHAASPQLALDPVGPKVLRRGVGHLRRLSHVCEIRSPVWRWRHSRGALAAQNPCVPE
jgi:hypothetical protein